MDRDTGPRGSLDRLSPADRVDIICDKFEGQWKSGQRPRIENFIDDTGGLDRSTLIAELLKVEVEYRLRNGEAPTVEEYAARFPELATQITSWEWLRSSAPLDERIVPAAASIPRRIAQFELLEQLGSGAFGSVWKARDTRLDRTVAVKVPHSGDQANYIGFEREARAAAQLRHPNIVSVHAAGRYGQTSYIVSDYIDGVNLKVWLRTSSLAPTEAAQLCAKLAAAVGFANARGVIHRDLKPSNILVDQSGEPHIADFGVAKRLSGDETLTASGHVVGTPTYMSPEQAAGRSHEVDSRSDVYSLGVILYELLTGRAPFEGEGISLLRKVEFEQPRPPRLLCNGIPRDLETVCLTALEKAPSRRYATALELADDLERFLRGEPVLALPVGRLERCWRWCRRSSARLGVASAAAVSIIVVLAALLLPQTTELNRQLVTITTDPPGAHIACIPLDRLTGEPLPSEIVHGPGSTPLSMPLSPGDYLVVAYLNDRQFHEVYRHVPSDSEIEHVRGRRALRWRASVGMFFLPDSPIGKAYVEEGADCGLPRIVIPQPDITADMALISWRTIAGNQSSANSRGVEGPAFTGLYASTHEFTVQQWQELFPPGELPRDEERALRDSGLFGQQLAALRTRWSMAIEIAERCGKRLPTLGEYRFAATLGGTARYPWGDQLPEDAASVQTWTAVGEPNFDRINLKGQPAVFGLCSNVAEWTAEPRRNPDGAITPAVCGGDLATISGSPRVSSQSRDPLLETNVNYKTTGPGLGFRLVRSAKPRLHAEDFIRPSE